MTDKSDDEAIVGITISILAIIYNIPLVYRVLKRKSARDIDLWFLLLRSVTVTITIAYGVMIDDVFIIVSNTIPLISSIIILLVKAVNHGIPGTWIDVRDYASRYIKKYSLDRTSPGWDDFSKLYNNVGGAIEVSEV